jgi:hypothetical protein
MRDSSHMIGNKFAAGNGPNRTSFRPGQTPWNKGMRGRHFSRATEFKKGAVPKHKVPIGTVRIRMHKNDKPRAWIKIAEPKTWMMLAVFIWERENGPLPAGYVVHHKDRDTINDSPDNLEAISRAAHMSEHRPEFVYKRVARLRAHRAGA